MRLVDLHCDTISECFSKKIGLFENNLQLDLKRGSEIEDWIQVFAICLDPKYKDKEAFNRFLDVYSSFKSEIEKNPQTITLYKSGDTQKNKCKALLALEGASPVGSDLNNINKLKQLGVAFLTLVWNYDNGIASGVLGSDRGLTQFGKEAVQELENQGIVIDISHLNQKGADELFSIAKKPIVATHSNSRAIFEHKRNLYDYQLDYLIKNNGLCGINFYPTFINGNADCCIEEMKQHIDHILSLGGENVLAIGSDFDGAQMPTFIKDNKGLYSLYDNMVKWYGEKVADKIFYSNAKGFIEKNI